MIIAFLFVSVSCSQGLPESFSVCFYNAYLLFDSSDDGWEYDGFRKGDGYTEEAYHERIRALAIFLAKYAESDVIVLAEVESDEVLLDLIEAGLDMRGYRFYGLARGPGPLSLGFISKRKPSSVNIHSTDGARPFLELSFDAFTILAIHARSRLEDDSADVRFNQFSHFASLLEEADGTAGAIGDFNADPRYGEEGMMMYPSAGWRDVPINVTDDPGRIQNRVYYSPLIDSGGDGTYYYQDEWYFYDNILLRKESFDSEGWEYSSAGIVRPRDAEDAIGRPDAYDASTGNGFSDHFPVQVSFMRRSGNIQI